MATRPAKESEIRYVVMLASFFFENTAFVIAGLDPAIHLKKISRSLMDARIKVRA
jgi:hypothetical protein